MSAFELLSQFCQLDLALLPLIALAVLPSLTSALGTVGGGLAATALGAGLGAGQGAIISAATGGDVGKGALIGAGTGAAGAGLGSVAGALGQGGAAAAEGASAGAQAGSAGADVAAQTATVAPEAAQVGTQSAVSAADIAPQAQAGFQAAKAAEIGADAQSFFGNQTGTFAEAPKSGLLVGPAEAPGANLLREPVQAGVQAAGAGKGGITSEAIVKALGKAATTGGSALSKGVPPGPPSQIVRQSLPNKVQGRIQPQVDPVLALLSLLKKRQLAQQQARTFF